MRNESDKRPFSQARETPHSKRPIKIAVFAKQVCVSRRVGVVELVGGCELWFFSVEVM